MEYQNLPLANLEFPMDLSRFKMEIIGDGVVGSNSNTSDELRNKPRRRRRRRRRRVNKSRSENQVPTDESKFQVRRKRGGRRNRKRKVNAKENATCQVISGSASNPLLSTNSLGPIQSFSQPSNDVSQVSQMEYQNLPWANLELPMDLSRFKIEIVGDGVDFDQQARENHLRWLANLSKCEERKLCI